MKIKSVLIVGGGTSGWMSAGMFSRQHPNLKVSLIESDNIDTVGVGESTIVLFNAFLDAMGMKDEDWMPACNATYKNNIRFTDFKEKGHSFDYPFGGDRGPETLGAWSQIRAQYELPTDSYADFCGSHNIFLARYNKNTKNKHKVLDFEFDRETAYHFDAELFGQYLRDKVCIPNGVTHHVDDVVGVEKDENGYITSVVGESGEKYSADLYVDCTGFKSLLLEQEMGSEFLSYKPWLSNDSALATHIPYTNKEEQLTNNTECTAINNGWVWDIPLWTNIGKGYVYSSDFVDDDTAAKEFKSHLGIEDVDLLKINIKHGVHKEAWVKNVIGIGLSYAFVEPLESTSLVSTLSLLGRLSELLRMYDNKVNQFIIDGFNYGSQVEMNNFKDFVSFHYKMSSRNDTPYWRYQTEGRDFINIGENLGFVPYHRPDGMALNEYERLLYHDNIGHNWPLTPGQGDGVYYLMAGMGIMPFGKIFFERYVLPQGGEDPKEKLEKIKSLYEEWQTDVENTIKYVKTLPSSHQFLQENIYGFDK
tara:strand:- start:76 stop:1674 length:1599 start_codon:yes stop_codon:yes gene_type:complete